MNVSIQVTQDDIDRGRPSDQQACPVAIAMTRVLGDRFRGTDRMFAAVDDHVVILPMSASIFMRAFDTGRPVLPFEFTVDIPDPEPEEDAP